MTVTRTRARGSLSSERYLLPWSAVLVFSISVAYATTIAINASWVGPDGRPTSGAPTGDVVEHSTGLCPSYFGAYGWLLYDMARTTGARCVSHEFSNRPTNEEKRP
jgi:hypothetical protein